jgi:hypothetical protein
MLKTRNPKSPESMVLEQQQQKIFLGFSKLGGRSSSVQNCPRRSSSITQNMSQVGATVLKKYVHKNEKTDTHSSS